jgi:hypothetical protein
MRVTPLNLLSAGRGACCQAGGRVDARLKGVELSLPLVAPFFGVLAHVLPLISSTYSLGDVMLVWVVAVDNLLLLFPSAWSRTFLGFPGLSWVCGTYSGSSSV